MTVWLLEPRDPLVARDNKPFGAIPGARATSFRFPMPSTIVGGLRTRAGSTGDHFDSSRIAELLGKGLRGPLLVELDGTGAANFLAPAPADAILFDDDHFPGVRGQIRGLEPIDVPQDLSDLDLSLVGTSQPERRKPAKHPPRFWYWRRFQSWLEAPGDEEVQLPELGHDGPTVERRTHVRLDAERGTAAEGALFQTAGLEFSRSLSDGASTGRSALEQTARLALVVATDLEISPGLTALGGERRTVAWRRPNPPIALPLTPSGLLERIAADGACRVVLLTPAYFGAGHRPDSDGWLLSPRGGVIPRLVGAVVNRPIVISGWDMAQGRPKPSRRLAPEGSVYFIRLEGDRDAVCSWLEGIWLQCVSDDAREGRPGQDRLDGFGLAVLGRWSGQPVRWRG